MAAPLAISVRDVSKTFRIPEGAPRTLGERLSSLGRHAPVRELHAVDRVSFELRRGDFLGVVGANASGKSTLLKLVAGIYAPDRGEVRVNGVLAPFIELGVGFNQELSARDNVVLSAVAMGLTRREARQRADAAIDFAELDDFRGLKLKNYSAGMRIRLAFAVMLQVDADVLLFDEVLAVGDASFQEKSNSALTRLRDDPRKTVVLVTHAMPKVQLYCNRALMLENGRLTLEGDPDAVVDAYTRATFERIRAMRESMEGLPMSDLREGARLDDLTVESMDGLEARQPIELRATAEALEPIERPALMTRIHTLAGVTLSQALMPLDARMDPGDRVTISAAIANEFAPGTYLLRCSIFDRDADGSRIAVSGSRQVKLTIRDPGWQEAGFVKLDYRVSVAPTPDGGEP